MFCSAGVASAHPFHLVEDHPPKESVFFLSACDAVAVAKDSSLQASLSFRRGFAVSLSDFVVPARLKDVREDDGRRRRFSCKGFSISLQFRAY